jgi:predicted cupin superfamily sugar epimerase
MTVSINELIETYKMIAHPEGGYYKETYRSNETLQEECLPIRFRGERIFSTGIYYLLRGDEFSAFHRIKSDEMWHFYAGVPLNIYVIDPAGNFELITMGQNYNNGEVFQAVIRAGNWFAAQPVNPNGFSFMGCTVAPGFDFEDFELARADQLTETYPQHADLIRQFCRI